MRVRLLQGVVSCQLSSTTGFDSVEGPLEESSLTIDLAGGRFRLAGQIFEQETLVLTARQSPTLELNGQSYRGRVKLVRNRDRQSFDVVNHVPLEPYLAGVVGAEMPVSWKPQALAAQAVVARTYGLYIKQRFGKNRHWDVSSTQAHQVYHGVRGESDTIWKAVRQTHGLVLVAGKGSAASIFPTYYSSICGGHTASSQAVFGEDVGPLQGVRCTHCQSVAYLNQYYWPVVQIRKEEVDRRLRDRYKALDKLGTIVALEPIRHVDHQDFVRVTRIRVHGASGGSDTLRAEDLRLTLDPAAASFAVRSFESRIPESPGFLWRGEDGDMVSDSVNAAPKPWPVEASRTLESWTIIFPGSSLKRLY